MTGVEIVVGLDLGTTMSKALARTLDGAQVALSAERTHWSTTAQGGTETSPAAMLDLAVGLVVAAIEQATARVGEVRVASIGVAGLAEAGVLLDAAGDPVAPVIAWFDRRGTREIDQLARRSPALAQQFPRRTGLPLDCQATVAKLMWLKHAGAAITGRHRWASLPEWIVHKLGADLVREPSLASRTGMIDQATGHIWEEGMVEAGLPTTLLPQPLWAGRSCGRVNLARLPACAQGAALTVAGHDHAVAALGVDAVGPGELFNSSGTADVVVRSVPGRLDDDQREQLVSSGLSGGAHILPDYTLVLGGVRGGLLLRRTLQALGADEEPTRHQLDLESMRVETLPPGLHISGAGPTGDDVVLSIRDGASPASIWTAATRYTAWQTRRLLQSIEHIVGPHTRAVACGGWTRMQSVRRAKREAVDHVTFSTLGEPGVTGAADLAQQAIGGSAPPRNTTAGNTDLNPIAPSYRSTPS
jgi:sugar (pentulose or hexulose) kinase